MHILLVGGGRALLLPALYDQQGVAHRHADGLDFDTNEGITDMDVSRRDFLKKLRNIGIGIGIIPLIEKIPLPAPPEPQPVVHTPVPSYLLVSYGGLSTACSFPLPEYTGNMEIHTGSSVSSVLMDRSIEEHVERHIRNAMLGVPPPGGGPWA